MNFTLSARSIQLIISTILNLIDDFNAKIRVAVLQQRLDWKAPQIKYLKLVIPERFTFMASNSVFILYFLFTRYYLEKTTRNKTLPLGSYKTSLNISSPPKSLSLYCKQINKVKNEVDGQASTLLA